MVSCVDLYNNFSGTISSTRAVNICDHYHWPSSITTELWFTLQILIRNVLIRHTKQKLTLDNVYIVTHLLLFGQILKKTVAASLLAGDSGITTAKQTGISQKEIKYKSIQNTNKSGCEMPYSQDHLTDTEKAEMNLILVLLQILKHISFIFALFYGTVVLKQQNPRGHALSGKTLWWITTLAFSRENCSLLCFIAKEAQKYMM